MGRKTNNNSRRLNQSTTVPINVMRILVGALLLSLFINLIVILFISEAKQTSYKKGFKDHICSKGESI